MAYPHDEIDRRIEKRAQKDLRAMRAPQLTMEKHKQNSKAKALKKMSNKERLAKEYKAGMRDLVKHGFGGVKTSSMKGKSVIDMAK